jgi:hypothetical protein
MTTATWFAADGCVRGYCRDEHVIVRLFGDARGTFLRQATCMASSGGAESALQRMLVGETHARRTTGNLAVDTSIILAEEVASSLDRAQAWRDWADWLWRHHDPRGTRIELGEALDAATGTSYAAELRAAIERHERQHGVVEQLAALQRASATVQRLGDAAPRLRFRHGQLIDLSGPLALTREHAPLLVALARVHTGVVDSLSFERLCSAIEADYLRSVVELDLELSIGLTPARTARLLELVHRRMPRLRELSVRASAGAHGLHFDHACIDALAGLLSRSSAPVHGVPLLRLELDFEGAWVPGFVEGFGHALSGSSLEHLRLRGPAWPLGLLEWFATSELQRRLHQLDLIERRAAPLTTRRVAATRPRPVPAPRIDEVSLADTAVWADWLQSQGDPLGELALLVGVAHEGELEARRLARVAALRCEIAERLSAGRAEALELDWRGPLLERVRLHGSRCEQPAALLERLVDHPACERLACLRISGIRATQLLPLLARVAPTLAGLAQLELAGTHSIARVLEHLPALVELHVGAPDLHSLAAMPPTNLRALRFGVPAEWSSRELRQMFGRLGPDVLPRLERLTLELEAGREGKPLNLQRLVLPRGAMLVIEGAPRECDRIALRRWTRYRENAVEFVLASGHRARFQNGRSTHVWR